MKSFKYLVVIWIFFLVQPALAETTQYSIAIKSNRFEPSEITIPAGQKVKLLIENQDPTPEEFESYDLNREKIVAGNSKISLFIGPLEPGEYKFFGEFNPETAQGKVIVR